MRGCDAGTVPRVREFSTPATSVVPAGARLTDDVLAHLHRDPARVLVRRPGDRPRTWVDVSVRQFHAEVTALARGLLTAGVGHGDRVGLLCRTRYEWTLVDYALWWVGAVTVPVYETASAEQLQWVLADSGAVGCVVERPEHARRVQSVRSGLPSLRELWTVGDGDLGALAASGAAVSGATLERRRVAVTRDCLATLVYTSGTTGQPKGCRLNHGHLTAELDAATEALSELFEGDQPSTLLVLPLAHVFARVIQIGCVRTGAVLGHCADVAELDRDLESFRPTFVLAVPRVFEAIYASASQRAAVAGRPRVFAAAVSTAVAWSRALDAGRPGLGLRARRALFDRLVYARLRRSLGGRVRYAVCGGGLVGDRLGHFFRGAGVPVLEGYGLTETSAAVTVNLPHEHKIGTVGRPLPGVTVRVADDGELLVRGGQVFGGYWGDDAQVQQATAAALGGGWLHTGDVGEVDGEGFVRVTGRRDELLVTAGGKRVAPAVLEERIRAHRLVSHCLVVGDGRPYVAALVTLDERQARGWARAHGRSARIGEIADDPDLRDAVQAAVDEANESVSPAESVRRFRVLASGWTEEDGHLTPSLELRRTAVTRDFRAEIDALYE